MMPVLVYETMIFVPGLCSSVVDRVRGNVARVLFFGLGPYPRSAQ